MAGRRISKERNAKKKDSDYEAAGLLFVGSILVFGVLGMLIWNTGLGWILGVGVGFILMAGANMAGKQKKL